MTRAFVDMLMEGGKKNSLGLVNDIIEIVLNDKSRLDELYSNIFYEDAWVRMRAIDAFEKICRKHPEWIQPYVDKIQKDLSTSGQPSIQWHIAEIYRQVELTESQKNEAIKWLVDKLKTPEVDWIVSANCMETLAYFTRNDDFKRSSLVNLLEIQMTHKSKSVVRRAKKILSEFS